MTQRAILTITVLSFAICSLAAAEEPAESRITLRIVVQGEKGVIRCALFSSPDTWLKNPQMKATAKPVKGSAECVFGDVAPGAYAISAYHDENDNAELDKSFFGAPREGTCTSGKPEATRRQPKFTPARFDYAGGELVLTARMTY